MTLRDDVRRHVSRLGLERDYLTDANTKYQITIASGIMNAVEAAMADCGVPEPTRRQVLDRVLYGTMPHRADTEVRQRLIDERVAALSRGRLDLVWDPGLQTFIGVGGGRPDGGNAVTGTTR